jgi:hypothetical protein
MRYHLSPGIFLFIIALFSLSACADTLPTPPTAETIAAPPTAGTQSNNALTIIFPQPTTELVGGQSLRATVLLRDFADQPVAGAQVTAELWTPGGELFVTLPCSDKGDGRYLADPISLPLRESQGLWQVVAQANWGDGMTAQAEGGFNALNSYSEQLQQLFGFWIELTDLFPYNISNAEDPRLKTYSYDDGGYVILANNLTPGAVNNSFVILDVHWRQQDLPQDEAAAIDYALDLAGPHRITLDTPTSAVTAERDNFQGWPAWHVTSWWPTQNALGNPSRRAPLDWMIFRCPGSDWLWTVLITTNSGQHMADLQSIRETFACSPA